MLGYNDDVSCTDYPVTLPQELDEAGYDTFIVGKDHFGFNETGNNEPITHGYNHFEIYDAENGAKHNDDYQMDWQTKYGDLPPVASAEAYTIDYNTWRATDYVYNESEGWSEAKSEATSECWREATAYHQPWKTN